MLKPTRADRDFLDDEEEEGPDSDDSEESDQDDEVSRSHCRPGVFHAGLSGSQDLPNFHDTAADGSLLDEEDGPTSGNSRGPDKTVQLCRSIVSRHAGSSSLPATQSLLGRRCSSRNTACS